MVFARCIVILIILNLAPWTPSALGQDIRFAVISDHRDHFQGLEYALRFIDSQKVDLILVLGDADPIAAGYAGYFSRHGYTVGREHRPDRQEIYFVLGNHDNPPGGESFFQDHIAPHYPGNGPPPAPHGTVFSFDWGACHFVVTNQYWDHPEGGYMQNQLNWLEQDLATSKQPYKFVLGHEPAFPRHRHVGDSLDLDPPMRDAFWRILTRQRVQAYLCAHTHFCSAVSHHGVYQLDAGEARDNHICVIIGEVDSHKITVHFYETNGSVPTVSDKRATIVLPVPSSPDVS